VVIAVPLVLTLDWVSAAVALALVFVLTPLAGIRPRTFWRRSAALWIAAPLAGVTIALYGQPSGASYVEFALVHVTAGSLALALATTLRILAIGIPAVLLFTDIDATALADGLAQLLHLPARFVLGSLAAFRLVALIAEDWRSLGRARRARGVADSAPLRRFAGQAFGLLVLSLRRATKLATAMEARAFGAPVRRTWARPSRFGRAEWAMIGLGLIVVVIAVSASVLSGHWRFVGA
jgi:energy-coupling factor transport system permease protein